MDLVVRCMRLPHPGETITAGSLSEVPGGKGANQAVAAVRAGGDVRIIGCVGDDGFGLKLLNNLMAESIDCDCVSVVEQTESGVAIVAVERSGENSIMVVPGANGKLSARQVAGFGETIRQSDVLMLQLEIPIDAVIEGVRIARAAGVRVILDPAPACHLPEDLLNVDLLCPNESEAALISGQTVKSLDDAKSVAESLREKGTRAVAITMGARGTLLCDERQTELIPSFKTQAVDTTAAGDAFAGALAVRWSETGSLADSVRWANAAGALAASRAGAQPSLPTRDQIDQSAC
jgi:ribokinase